MASGLGLGLAYALAAANAAPLPVATTANSSPILDRAFRLLTATRAMASPILPMTRPRVEQRWAVSDLVAVNREGGRDGHVVRHPRMTAGLSLRFTNQNGVLASTVGMSGAAGRALTRIAYQAIDAGNF